MDEVAETASHTSLARVEATTSFAEIRHGGEFAIDGARGVPSAVELVAGLLGGFLVLEAGVDIADEI